MSSGMSNQLMQTICCGTIAVQEGSWTRESLSKSTRVEWSSRFLRGTDPKRDSFSRCNGARVHHGRADAVLQRLVEKWVR